MYVVIMGCGRVGSGLATALEQLGHEVAIIDKNPEAFRRLGAEFRGRQITGIGFDKETLLKADIQRAEAFAAVSNGDNSNIISARVARETFGLEKVVARIYDYKRAAVYERLGIPTIATVPWALERFLHTILPEGSTPTWEDPSGKAAILHISLHEDWAGKEINFLEETLQVRVAFLLRFGNCVIPHTHSVLQADDQVYVAVAMNTLHKVATQATEPPGKELSS